MATKDKIPTFEMLKYMNDTINDEMETLSNNQGNFLIFTSTNPNSKYQVQFQKINGKPTLIYSIKEDEE